MFHDFDQRFFNGVLVNNGVEVNWSPRMTLCAGLCRWSPRDLSCEIKLSKPLLQLRSRKDVVETLIHEMIHALLFVKRDSDNRESHGPKFHLHMFRINQEATLNISVYHTFHDEVRHYQNHVWRCKGICRNRSPYYGWVRRSMNRKPGPNDKWWAEHQQTCGGEFEKISEPENSKNDKNKNSKENQSINKTKDIRQFFTPIESLIGDNKSNSINNLNNLNNERLKIPNIVGFDDLDKEFAKDDLNLTKIIPFSGKGKILGTNLINNPQPGKSILLQKFGSNLTHSSQKATSSTIINSKPNDKLPMYSINSTNGQKPTNSTIITSRSNDKSPTNCINLNDKKSSVHHLDDSLVGLNNFSTNKRQKLDETVTLSDDDDDADYSWLNDVSDQDLLKISQTDCIVID